MKKSSFGIKELDDFLKKVNKAYIKSIRNYKKLLGIKKENKIFQLKIKIRMMDIYLQFLNELKEYYQIRINVKLQN